jgi:hypothetical protein
MSARNHAEFGSIVEQHATMHALADRIEEIISAELDLREHRIVSCLVEELGAHCKAHMALEEKDGYLPLVRQQSPHNARAIDRLLAEHAPLRARIIEINVTLATTEARHPATSETLDSLRSWLRDLRDHERRETLIVQEAWHTDIGTGD